MWFAIRIHTLMNFQAVLLAMYRPYVVQLQVYDGVESKLTCIRGGLWDSLGSYVCNVITLIHRIMCVMCTVLRTVKWYNGRVDGKLET